MISFVLYSLHSTFVGMKLLKYSAAIVLLLGSVMLFARQDGKGKMSGWVRMLVESRQVQEARKGVDGKSLMRQRKATALGSEPAEPRTIVFLQVKPEHTDALMADFDGKKWAQLDDIAIVEVPVSRLEELVERDEVMRVEANERASLTTDTTASIIGADKCYVADGGHPAYTGEGIIVGVMDVGFDLTHPIFYDATHSSYRVGALWDMLAPDGDGMMPVGRTYKGRAALMGLGYTTDSQLMQHGTHTAGIVASGHETYRGIAYGSEVCLVANVVTGHESLIAKNCEEMYTSATDALGFKYLFDYAEEAGKPCVVSFSEGYAPYMDQDDSLYSEFLGKLQGPGRILVSSAGNENNQQTYYEKPVGMEAAGAYISTSSKKSAFYRMKSNGPMTMRLCAYRNGSVTPTDEYSLRSEDALGGKAVNDTLFLDSDTCAILVYKDDRNMTGEDLYFFSVSCNKNITQLPPLALIAEGADSRVEVFGSTSSYFTNKSVDTRWNSAVKGRNVMAPGCFPTALCVGATTHRLLVTNYQGNPITWTTATVKGLRADYSSTGPTMSGQTKPDVLAPGTNVVSGYNSRYMESHPIQKNSQAFVTTINGREYAWGINSGTSMATPVVAGTVALWLQADPSLTRDDVMDIISVTSRKIDQTATYPNSLDGYGEIQAHAGLIEVLRRKVTGLDELSYNPPQKVRASAVGGMLRLSLSRPSSAPVRLRLYAVNGILLKEEMLPSYQDSYTIPLPPQAHGVVILQLNSADKTAEGSLLIKSE